MKSKAGPSLWALIFVLGMALGGLASRSQDQPQGQGQQQAGQDQQQSGQDQTQTGQQPKKKKKGGGFFGGLKAITGESSEQTEAAATAGSKSVGEGEKIGNVTPTAANRQQVKGMENYSVPEQDVKKFQQDGNLKPQP